MPPKQFKDIQGIKRFVPDMVGKKISTTELIGKKILVHSYKIAHSKYDKGHCIYIQIYYNGEKRVVFTSSKGMLSYLKQISKEDFPFVTT